MFPSPAIPSSSARRSISSELPSNSSRLGNAAQVLSNDLRSQTDTSGSFVFIPSFGRVEHPAVPPIPSVIEIVRYSRPDRLIENIPVLADKSDPDLIYQLRNDLAGWVAGTEDLLEKNERGNVMIRVIRCLRHQLPALAVKGPNITELPDCIGLLDHLKVLDLSNCRSLRSLPNVLHHFIGLRYLNLENCSSLTALPPTLIGLNRSATLFLSGSGIDLLNPLGRRFSQYLPPPPPEQP